MFLWKGEDLKTIERILNTKALDRIVATLGNGLISIAIMLFVYFVSQPVIESFVDVPGQLDALNQNFIAARFEMERLNTELISFISDYRHN